MKAVTIMLFLVIFNIVISAIGLLHIYNMGGSFEDTNVSGVNASLISHNSGENSLFVFGITLAGTTIVGGILGASYSILTKQPASEGIAYGTFGGLVTGVFISSYNILWSIVNIVPPYARLGAGVIIGIFLGITGLLFIIGFIQLIRGGMKTYI